MLNIEIYGFKSDQDIREVRIQIFKALSGTEFVSEVVITPIPSFCGTIRRVSKPFLRVCDTDIKRAKKIAGVLEKTEPGYDIKILELARFYPKRH